ncbi:hypothetical protein KHC23_15680 [Ancylobacter dichloromethanicus]|uniref:Uncharacterized protein n=1 Tax=Ancylobacter dichloromethanicus TaxID=518825 RepID=A0A9W6MZM6_9HYPH|nr:hypothetical protein [Ancylobacter dichloromethanicus]MBS7555088.1 hypothetical protein [Ancylobacter dichloromethanicus]GLK72298.1 hypothetical protein GCM10017643_24140 [Ancylobacter dichloromethanicus]
MTGIDSIFKGSAYLIGATTGVALMVPLTAGALATGSMTRLAPHPVAIEAFGPGAAARHPVVRAPMVNRAAKGPRLDLAPRDAASSTVGSPAASSLAPAPVRPTVSPAAVTPNVVNTGPETAPAAPARATRTPKGCLSAIGVTKSSLSTEELTVCVADASMISHIN